jgi:NAD-dependent deacetylase sirtuin 4
VQHIVTQNVDQLHYKVLCSADLQLSVQAGCRSVVELHGTNSLVTCTTCTFTSPRIQFQETYNDLTGLTKSPPQRRLEELNPDMRTWSQEIRPDGDVELSEDQVLGFKVPGCPKCDTGILKPFVVFFGDNVPRPRVEKVRSQVEQADALLVVGSSLFVFSGYRFVTQAKELGLPVAVLNIGATRADSLVDLKIEAKAGDVLPRIDMS